MTSKSADKSNAEIARHSLAIAWDKWLASEEGQECSAEYSRGVLSREYQENRLHRAFDVGATTAQSSLAEKVLAEVGQWRHAPAASNITNRLRGLFTELGIEIEEPLSGE